MPSKTLRFAFAFALVFPLALAYPAAAQGKKGPAAAEAAPQPTVRDATAPAMVQQLDAEDVRRQLEDVLKAYPQSPAGRRFLESTPISVDAPRALAAPISRILWSAQAGAVLTVLGVGITVVSRTTLEEVAAPLAAIGAVILALGIGFLVSSA